MEVCRYLTRCLTFRTTSPQLYRPLATSVSPLSFRKSFTSQSLDSGQPIIDKSSELFEYTSGRWMYVEPNYFKLKLMTDYSLKLQ